MNIPDEEIINEDVEQCDCNDTESGRELEL